MQKNRHWKPRSKKQIQVIIRECLHCSTHPTQLQEEIQIDEKLEQNFISHILIRSNCEVKSRSEKGGANQVRIKQRTSSRVPPPSFSFLPTSPVGAPSTPGTAAFSSRMCHDLRWMEKGRERQADSRKP
jgi:hypothetical protein